MNKTEQKKKKFKYFWDNIKQNNILILGVPEGEDRKKRPESN